MLKSSRLAFSLRGSYISLYFLWNPLGSGGVRPLSPTAANIWSPWTSLVAQTVKHLPTVQETQVQSLDQEDPPEEGNGSPLQYSCLENPMDRGAWWATVHGAAESDKTEQLHFTLSQGSPGPRPQTVCWQSVSNCAAQQDVSREQGSEASSAFTATPHHLLSSGKQAQGSQWFCIMVSCIIISLYITM